MTTTRSRSADRAEISADEIDGSRAAPTPSADTETRVHPSKRARSQVEHRNTVCLVGELTEPVEPRQRADTGEVLTFRIGVRITSPSDGVETSSAGSREVANTGRRDVVDCAITASVLRRRLESYQAGDVIEVQGALRHRFWNSGGRVQSRYEVDVGALKRLARVRPGRT